LVSTEETKRNTTTANNHQKNKNPTTQNKQKTKVSYDLRAGKGAGPVLQLLGPLLSKIWRQSEAYNWILGW